MKQFLLAAALAVAPSSSIAGGVALTFDDAWESTYATALPLMESYGIVGTLFVPTGLLGTPHYMQPNALKAFVDAGWEVGAHTIYHDNLLHLTLDLIRENLEKPKEYLAELGIEVRSFSSPYGSFNEEVIEEIKKYYDIHVNAWSDTNGMNTWQTLDQYNINRWTIRNTDSAAEVCEKIKSLKENEVFVIVAHDISTDDEEYDILPSTLESILQCIVDNKVIHFRIGDLIAK